MNYTFLEHFVLLDALASPFQGMSQGHIVSHFNSIESFIDVRDALKDHPERWRKSALYTAFTQMAVVISLSASKHRFNSELINSLYIESSLSSEEWTALFRYPDQLTASFLASVVQPGLPPERAGGVTPVLYTTLFSLMTSRKEPSFKELAVFALEFTTDPGSLVGSLVFERLVRSTAARMPESFCLEFRRILEKSESELKTLLPFFFEKGIDPTGIEHSIEDYRTMARLLSSEEASETAIIASAQSRTKNSLTRATIDMPLLMIPFILLAVDTHKDEGRLYGALIKRGGAVQQMVLLAGMLMAKADILNEEFPGLGEELVNKGKIGLLLKRCVSGKLNDADFADFIASERKLSQKADDELKSICKHSKKKGKKPGKSARSKRLSEEEQLARHVANSWTKRDKSRYKKERQHSTPDE
ncbi:MAG: hypothetical protein PF637_06930 [Spirochaetes bacterium]|jgi:hypothetical protein|nr:hypothetical protein [Spirochaetota bacterium]